MKKIHFKFLGVSRRKNDRKQDENARNCARGTASDAPAPGAATARAPDSPASNPMSVGTQLPREWVVFLFFKLDRYKKLSFLLLNPK